MMIHLTPTFPWRRLSAVVAVAVFCMTVPAVDAAEAADGPDMQRIITEEARKTSVPASLALAVARVESGLRADHQGADGGRGLFQVSPDTARDMGTDPRDLWQPRTNTRLALGQLAGLLERADGRWDAALNAYATRHGRIDPAGQRRYVADVFGWERKYAERLALSDAINGRRREVLMSGNDRDDWAQQADDAPGMASKGHDRLPSAPDQTDPMLDDDTDVAAAEPVYRGREQARKRDRVKITVYEEEYEVTPPAWRRPPPSRWAAPPPPPRWQRPPTRHFRGPQWSPRKASRLKRMARRAMRRHQRRQQ